MCGGPGVILLVAIGIFEARAEVAPILLSCHGAAETDATVVAVLCDTLAAELSSREPARVVRQAVASEPLPQGAWDVVLEVMSTEPNHWEGRLTWKMNGSENHGTLTTGPPLKIFGMDAPLGPGAYSHFIRDLLKVSKPTF